MVLHRSITPSHTTTLHILAVDSRCRSILVIALLDLFFSMVVDVLDVECVDAVIKLALISKMPSIVVI